MNSQVVAYGADMPGGMPAALLAVLVFIGLLVLVPTWALLARSRYLSGDTDVSAGTNRIAQLYGYTVCLIAILAALLSVPSIVDNTFRLRDPLRADNRWGFQPSLDSFEAYKATYRGEQMFTPAGQPAHQDSLTEDERRRRFEALRADRIASVRFQAQRGLTGSVMTFVIAVGLFAVHWWWVKRRVEVRVAERA